MGKPATRPWPERSGDGRGELCLSVAVALHALVIDVALVRALAPPPTRPVRVERTIDVEFEARPPPPPRPPPEPIEPEVVEPSPKPAPAALGDPNDPFADAKPLGPVPMEAAKILTTEGAGDGPAIVSGNAAGPSYGFVSADGMGTAPTFDVLHGGARDGVLGGKSWGHGREAGFGLPAAPAVNRSRPAHVVGGYKDTCPFPPEAKAEHIDHAVVTISATVRPDGKVQTAHAVSDPGHGFAREAERCALSQVEFIPALDAAGTPIWSPSVVFSIRFIQQ